MKKAIIPESFQVALISILVLLLYVVAMIYPDTWWGLHYPAFLSSGKGWVLVVLAIGFTLFGQKYSFWEGLANTNNGGYRWLWTVALTIISGIFFYQLPIYLDVYGDANSILTDKDLVVAELTETHKEMLLDLDFSNLKLGTGTTLGLVAWLSYSQEIPAYEAFRIIGAVCGMGYVFFMLASVYKMARDSQQRFLLTFLVLGTSAVQCFAGHVEVYAPIYFLLAAFWFAMIHFLEKPSVVKGLILGVICFLILKFHITGILTLFVAFVAMVIVIRRSLKKEISWKQIGMFILGPVLALGAIVYLFVTKSMFGPRVYSEDNLTDAIFIPLKSSDPAPYDRYNLFSWNHIFDYFNLALFWSAMAIVIIVTALVFKRKTINWSTSLVKVAGVALISYIFLFFVLNPLLSMQTDWDLMSIPAIALLIFAASIITSQDRVEENKRSFTSHLISPAIGLFVISWTCLFVNSDQENLSNRLQSSGKRSFKTYWIGSSTPILAAISLIDDEEDQLKALENIVIDLEPNAVRGVDIEYAELLNKIGRYHQDYYEDFEEAHKWYLKANEADPMLRKNVFNLVTTHFIRKEYIEANNLTPLLVRMGYPNPEKALRMGVHISLEANDYEASEIYCEQLLGMKPGDTFIQEILQLLRTSEDKSTIKLRFRSS